MNKDGPSQVGPDLNLPLNPTEYLKESVLPRYIRNPKAIRSWEGSKMPGFGPETFSDEDIANIVAYLKEMALKNPTATRNFRLRSKANTIEAKGWVARTFWSR